MKMEPKTLRYIAAGVLVVVFGVALFFIGRTSGAARRPSDASLEQEFSQKLSVEREKIKRDLDEKYRADMVSYEAMAKRLQLEKEKVKELEEKAKK